MSAAAVKASESIETVAAPRPSPKPKTDFGVGIAAVDGPSAGGVSPARDLQARLVSEMGRKRKTSLRAGLAMLAVVAISTWVAGILLYATL